MGLVFAQELAILLGEPVPKPTGFLQLTLKTALALAGSLLAGNGRSGPRNPGKQPGDPTEDTDTRHGSPQQGVKGGNLSRLPRRPRDLGVRIIPRGRQRLRR